MLALTDDRHVPGMVRFFDERDHVAHHPSRP